MEKQNYETIKEDIGQFLDLVKLNINDNQIAKEKFLGYRVFYSPLIINPTVLFIGINPGAGQLCEYLDPEERFEYLDYDFTLAKETKQVFSEIGCSHILENSAVKINYYYIITPTETELYNFTALLEPTLGRQFYEKSGEWTKRMISLINPKIIICEGRRAYDKVTELYQGDWKETKLSDCWLYENPENNITVVGYSRRYSNIKNKSELAELLKPLLTNQEVSIN